MEMEEEFKKEYTRRLIIKIAVIVAAIAVLVVGFFGVRSLYYRSEKTFTDPHGCSVTLTHSFTEHLETGIYTVTASKACMTTKHYASETVAETYGEIKTAKAFADVYYPDYENAEILSCEPFEGDRMLVTYHYHGNGFDDYCCDLVAMDRIGFCIVTFWCETPNETHYDDMFPKWAKTVRVAS